MADVYSAAWTGITGRRAVPSAVLTVSINDVPVQPSVQMDAFRDTMALRPLVETAAINVAVDSVRKADNVKMAARMEITELSAQEPAARHARTTRAMRQTGTARIAVSHRKDQNVALQIPDRPLLLPSRLMMRRWT